MIITIKNVEKQLMQNNVKCDIHFHVTQNEGHENFAVNIYETNTEGITKNVGYIFKEKDNHDFIHCKGYKTTHIRNKRLIITSCFHKDDVLMETSKGDIFSDDEYRVVPCKFYYYKLYSGFTTTKLAVQHKQELGGWGFACAYLKALDYYDVLEADDYMNYNEAIYTGNTVDLNVLIDMFGQEVIEY